MSPVQATTTSPSRGRTPASTAPNQPRGDRVVAGQHLGPVAEDGAPGGDDVVDRAARAVEVPEAGLAAEQHQPVAQLGVVVDVDPALRRRVDHAVVGDDDAAGCRDGSASRSCSASASTIASCCSHWLEATPYRWPVQSRSPS